MKKRRNILIPLFEIEDALRNNAAKLQRLAQHCQSCSSPRHHSIYEFLIKQERWLREMEELYGSDKKSDGKTN